MRRSWMESFSAAAGSGFRRNRGFRAVIRRFLAAGDGGGDEAQHGQHGQAERHPKPIANVHTLLLQQIADFLVMPLLRIFVELFLHIDDVPQQFDGLVEILQLDHVIANLLHGQQDRLRLLLRASRSAGARS